MTNSQPPNDTPDSEAQFYTVLAGSLDGERMPVVDDFLKVTDGPQAITDSNGNVAVLLTLSPDGAELLVDSCNHWYDHDCEAAKEFAKFFMYLAGKLVLDMR